MSVTVKHLNADSSFLLIFEPDQTTSEPDSHLPTGNHTNYTVLLDPWVTGNSIVTAPWLAITKRRTPACISHLSEIEEPDLVIVSQNKPDHCHEETLRQLRPGSKTTIAAEPGAAKKIKSWNVFDPAKILSLPRFRDKDKFSLLRFYIPPLSRTGHPGEVTVAFIPAKNYTTGLHNAIGITYRPPTHALADSPPSPKHISPKKSFYRLPLSPTSLPASVVSHALTPQQAPALPSHGSPNTTGFDAYRPRISRVFRGKPIELMYPQAYERERSPPDSASNSNETSSTFSTISSPVLLQSSLLPTPPCSPRTYNLSPISTHSGQSDLGHSMPLPLPKPLSILYTPHGINFEPDLQPYVRHHLVKSGSLPLSVLLHSFDRVQNPWYLGGNMMTGIRGGAEIACGLMAKSWISAHDEAKSDQGLLTSKLVFTRRGVEEAEHAIDICDEDGALRKRGWHCDVQSLEVGAEMTVCSG